MNKCFFCGDTLPWFGVEGDHVTLWFWVFYLVSITLGVGATALVVLKLLIDAS
jgi:hypothetical protein